MGIQVGADTYVCEHGSTINVVIDGPSKWTHAFCRKRTERGHLESDAEMQARVVEAVAKMRLDGRKVSLHPRRASRPG